MYLVRKFFLFFSWTEQKINTLTIIICLQFCLLITQKMLKVRNFFEKKYPICTELIILIYSNLEIIGIRRFFLNINILFYKEEFFKWSWPVLYFLLFDKINILEVWSSLRFGPIFEGGKAISNVYYFRTRICLCEREKIDLNHLLRSLVNPLQFYDLYLIFTHYSIVANLFDFYLKAKKWT